MENIVKESIRIENALNNLLEASVILKDLKTSIVDKFPLIMSIHEYSGDFIDDYELIEDFLLSNNKNVDKLSDLKRVAHNAARFFGMKEAHDGKKKYYTMLYKESPVKAIEMISGFINDDSITMVQDYIYSNGIYNERFESALDAVKKVDSYLYGEYEKKINYIEESKYDRATNNLKEIALGIETGYLSDGTEFDVLEFWKLAPFKYSKGIVNDFKKFKSINPNIGYIGQDNFYRRIEAFSKGVLPEKADIILDYMKKNKLFTYTYMTFQNYRKIHGGGPVEFRMGQEVTSAEDLIRDINGNEKNGRLYDKYYITNQVQKRILREILDRKLPHIIEVYAILENRYMDEYIKQQPIIKSDFEEPSTKVAPTIKLTSNGQRVRCRKSVLNVG